MSEFPRVPGHPSDMPSNRSSEGAAQKGSNTPINIYTTPPPPPTAAPAASGSNHLRNLIIGAVITAVGSISVYYATVYQNKEKNETDNTKKATTTAWGSFVAYENAYTKNALSLEKTLLQNGNFSEYLDGFKKESAKFTSDLSDVTKRKDVDKDLVKAIERRLENEKTGMKKLEEYLANIKALQTDTITSLKIKMERLLHLDIERNNYYKGAFERAVNDIQEIAATLSDRYNAKFSTSDLLVVQIMPQKMKSNDSTLAILENSEVDENGVIVRKSDPEGYAFVSDIKPADIIGSWNTDGNAISFQKNGNMIWVLAGGGKATGPWKIEKGKIRVDATIEKNGTKVTWYMSVSQLSHDRITLTNALPPYEFYHLVRIMVN